MNKEFEQIYESYKQKILTEHGAGRDAIGYDQQRKPQNYRVKPKTSIKNSFGGVMKTDQLPGSPGAKISMGLMPSGVSIDEEEKYIDGYGKMSKKDIHDLYNKVMKQAHELKAAGKKTELEPKLGLLKTLSKYL
jgi:septin family protein